MIRRVASGHLNRFPPTEKGNKREKRRAQKIDVNYVKTLTHNARPNGRNFDSELRVSEREGMTGNPYALSRKDGETVIKRTPNKSVLRLLYIWVARQEQMVKFRFGEGERTGDKSISVRSGEWVKK